MDTIVPPCAVYIYTLSEPDTGNVRYVGKTIRVPRMRLYQHITQAKRENKGYISSWIRGLLARDLHPVQTVIEVADVGNWAEREKFHIAAYRASGCRLVNLTDGGEGMHGLKPTPETTAKRSAKHRARTASAETRAKMSRAQKGRVVSEATREKIRAARKRQVITQEECDRRSKARKGRRLPEAAYANNPMMKKGRPPMTEAGRAKWRAAVKGRPCALEDVAKRAESNRLRWADPEFRARRLMELAEGKRRKKQERLAGALTLEVE